MADHKATAHATPAQTQEIRKNVSSAPKPTEKLDEKEPPTEVGAVVNPDDPGYKAQLAPDTGGYVNIAERAQDDAKWAEKAEKDGTLPQSTLDEIEAGREALERRNGKGRKLDAADVDELKGAKRAAEEK